MTQLSLAILIAAVILGAAYVVSHRYAIVATGGTSNAVWKIDQLTGEMLLCGAVSEGVACIQPRPGFIKSK
jgi:hypothetical protein